MKSLHCGSVCLVAVVLIACDETDAVFSVEQAFGTYAYRDFSSGDSRGYTGDGDWSNGYFKGECATNEAITGLSASVSAIAPRKIQCESGRGAWSSTAATVSPNGGDSRRETSKGDWAFGYWKGECGLSEAVVGISRDGGGAVRDLRCASSGVAAGSCTARTLDTGDSRGRTSTGDWDFGNYKAECADGEYVKGVSLNPSNGHPHSILCCSGSSTPVTWRKANLTWYTSYPDPGSEECIEFNGCTWAGYFAYFSEQKPESWVAATNIAAVHSKDWDTYKGKTLQLRKDGHTIDVNVYDMCSDSDCSGCCTQNASQNGYDFLIDIESYTKDRFGVEPSGTVEWRCLNCP